MALEASHFAIVQALHDAEIGLTRGVNLFAGPLRPGKGLTCFVQATGGAIPTYLSQGAQVEMATVQVSVWSPQDVAEAGETLARQAIRVLHRKKIGGYFLAAVREAEPQPIGRDDSGRNGYAINVELHGLRV